MATTRVQATPDTSAIRTEILSGREHTVVPLIALVEGVLRSANSPQPELAPASEFGKFPLGWNGRPVTLGHPKINQNYVSANSPEVLKDWSVGQLFNTRLDGKKLKTEAWIDVQRANELSDEGKNLIARLQAGQMIEVSTGLFTEVINIHGIHEGDEFFGIWSNVTPDHLAMLNESSVGACSVEDGCGAPRLNNAGFRMNHSTLHLTNCPCGGGDTCQCAPKGAEMSGETPPKPNSENPTPTTVASGGGGGGKSVVGRASGANGNAVDRRELAGDERYEALMASLIQDAYPGSESAGGPKASEFPSNMPIDNVRTLLRDALEDRSDFELFTLRTFTRDQVVFEIWEDMKLRSMNFNVAEGGSVTFTSEPTVVNLLTRISPRVNANDGEHPMADTTDTKVATTAANPGNGSGGPGSSPATPPAAPLTANSLEELLAHASPELKASIEAGQALMQAKINADIASIVANSNNTFSEAELKGFAPAVLAKMAALAKQAEAPASTETPPATATTTTPESPAPAPQANYGGRALPTKPDDPNAIPAALEAFPRGGKGAKGSNGSTKEA